MEIPIGKAASLFGFVLAVVEIWRPRLSIKLEKIIDAQMHDVDVYRRQYLRRFRLLSKVAETTWREVGKGPQLMTPKQLKETALTSYDNMRDYLWFYLATGVYFIVLTPVKVGLVLLNRIGRGRAVGGIGLLLGLLGFAL